MLGQLFEVDVRDPVMVQRRRYESRLTANRAQYFDRIDWVASSSKILMPGMLKGHLPHFAETPPTKNGAAPVCFFVSGIADASPPTMEPGSGQDQRDGGPFDESGNLVSFKSNVRLLGSADLEPFPGAPAKSKAVPRTEHQIGALGNSSSGTVGNARLAGDVPSSRSLEHTAVAAPSPDIATGAITHTASASLNQDNASSSLHSVTRSTPSTKPAYVAMSNSPNMTRVGLGSRSASGALLPLSDNQTEVPSRTSVNTVAREEETNFGDSIPRNGLESALANQSEHFVRDSAEVLAVLERVEAAIGVVETPTINTTEAGTLPDASLIPLVTEAGQSTHLGSTTNHNLQAAIGTNAASAASEGPEIVNFDTRNDTASINKPDDFEDAQEDEHGDFNKDSGSDNGAFVVKTIALVDDSDVSGGNSLKGRAKSDNAANSMASIHQALVVEEVLQPQHVSDVMSKEPGIKVQDITFITGDDDIEPLKIDRHLTVIGKGHNQSSSFDENVSEKEGSDDGMSVSRKQSKQDQSGVEESKNNSNAGQDVFGGPGMNESHAVHDGDASHIISVSDPKGNTAHTRGIASDANPSHQSKSHNPQNHASGVARPNILDSKLMSAMQMPGSMPTNVMLPQDDAGNEHEDVYPDDDSSVKSFLKSEQGHGRNRINATSDTSVSDASSRHDGNAGVSSPRQSVLESVRESIQDSIHKSTHEYDHENSMNGSIRAYDQSGMQLGVSHRSGSSSSAASGMQYLDPTHELVSVTDTNDSLTQSQQQVQIGLDQDASGQKDQTAETTDAPQDGVPATQDDSQAAPQPERKVPVIEAGAMFITIKAYHAQDLDELELELGDTIELDMTPASKEEYWWKGTNRTWGKRNGQQGFFPKDSVKFYDPDDPDDDQDAAANAQGQDKSTAQKGTATQDEAELVCPDPVPPGTKVVVRYPYEPVKADELQLNIGEMIVVMEAPVGGWWKGMKGLNEKTPKTGWFPATLIDVEKDPSKLMPGAGPDMKRSATATSNTDHSNDSGPHSKVSSANNSRRASKAQNDSLETNISPDQSRKGVSWLRRLVPDANKTKEKEKEKRMRSISAPVPAQPNQNSSMSSVSSSGSSAAQTSGGLPTVDDMSEMDISGKMNAQSSQRPNESSILETSTSAADDIIAALEASAAIAATSSDKDAPPSSQSPKLHLNTSPDVLKQDGAQRSSNPSSVQKDNMDSSGAHSEDQIIPMRSNHNAGLLSPISKGEDVLSDMSTHRKSESEPPFGAKRTDDDVSAASALSPAHTPSNNLSVEHFAPTNRTSVAIRNTMYIQGNMLSPADYMRGSTNEQWQDRVDKATIASLTSAEKKRLAATWELIQTERDYVRDIAIIIEVFMKPMMALKSNPVKTVTAIFANIEQILNVNADFLNQMEVISDIKNVKAYTDAFIATGERFLCYIPFCANQNVLLSKLNSTLNSKPELRSFIDEAYKNPLLRQMDLGGFLLKPVQRICKYPLLLREINKHTDKNHPDFPELQRALERMHRVVSTVNESARRMNGMKSILDVQNRFAEKINIANPNRFLVRDDVIYVVFSGYRKTRRLFLFNDILILARKDWRDKNHVIEKSPLKDVRVCEIVENGVTPDSTVTTSMLEIEILPTSEFDPPNHYVVSTTALPEKISWLEAYKSLAKHAVKSKQISEISMTSSSRESGGDDDEGEKVQPWAPPTKREPDEEEIQGAVSRALASKTADFQTRCRELEQQAANNLQKVNELTALIKERDDQIVKLNESAKTASEGFEEQLKSMKEQAWGAEMRASEVEMSLKSVRGALTKKTAEAAEQASAIQVLRDDLTNNRKTLSETQATLKSTQDDLETTRAELGTTKGELETTRSELATTKVELENSRAELATTKGELETSRAELATTKGELEKTKLTLKDTKDELSRTQSTLGTTQAALAQRNEELSSAQSRIKKLETNLEEADRNHVTSQARIQLLEKQNAGLTAELSQRTKDLAQATAELDGTRERVGERGAALEGAQKTIHAQAEALQKTQAKVQEQTAEIARLEKSFNETTHTLRLRETTIKGLEEQLSNAHGASRDRDTRIESLDRNLKETRIKLADTETTLLNLQQKIGHKEVHAAEIEAINKDFRLKLNEIQNENTSMHAKVAQRETKLQDLERELRDLKLRSTETELMYAALQQKSIAKEVKLAETEALLTSLQSTHTQLKQKLSDTEHILTIAQERLVDHQNKLKIAEAGISSAATTRAALEQRISDLKSQVQTAQEQVGKLERERKDLTVENENLSHDISSLNKDVRLLREQIKDMKTENEKSETQRATSLRDAIRELNITEDKWKSLLEKEKRDRGGDLAAVVAEFQAYKISSSAEITRMKSEWDAQVKQTVKEYEERLNCLREQSDARVDQSRVLLEHEKAAALEKIEEMRNVQIQRLTQMLEATRVKAVQTADTLKRSLQETQERLKEREQVLAAKEEALRTKEHELIVFTTEARQLTSELTNVSTAAEATRIQYRTTVDDLEKALQERQLMLTRKDTEMTEISQKLIGANNRSDNLEQAMQRMRSELEERRQAHEDTMDQFHETGTVQRTEIVTLKQRLQQLETSLRETSMQLEAAKNAQASLSEMNRRMNSEIDQMTSTTALHTQQVAGLTQERQNLQSQVRDLTTSLESKTREANALSKSEVALKDAIRKREEAVHETALRAERAELRMSELERMLRTQDSETTGLREQLKVQSVESKERLREEEITALRRLEKELEVQRTRLMQDSEDRVRKLSDTHTETIARLEREHEVALNQRNIERNDLNSKIDDLSRTRDRLQEDIAGLEGQVDSMRAQINELSLEFEDKVKQLVQTKKRARQLDTENATMKERVQQTTLARDTAVTQHRELFEEHQKLQADISQTRTLFGQLQSQVEAHSSRELAHNEVAEQLRQALQELEQLRKAAKQSEASLLNANKSTSGHLKQLASVQMTLNEIAKLVDVPQFWTDNELAEISSKPSKDGNRKGGLSLRAMDNVYLVRVVGGVSDVVGRSQKLKDELAAESARLVEYQELQRSAEQELSAASSALQAIEERVHERDVLFVQERETAEKHVHSLQLTLEGAIKDKQQVEVRLRKTAEKLTAVEREKENIEQNFVQLYERLKNGKESHAKETLHFSQQIAALELEKSQLETQLLDISRQMTALSDKTHAAEAEKNRMRETLENAHQQRAKSQQLLEAANATAKSLAFELERCRDQVAHLRDEVQQLRKERVDFQQHSKAITDKLNNELARTRDELLRLVSESSVLRETAKERIVQIERLEDKLNKAERREMDLRDRAYTLSEDLKREKVRSLSLEQEHDQIKSYSTLIESKLQAIHMRSQQYDATAAVRAQMAGFNRGKAMATAGLPTSGEASGRSPLPRPLPLPTLNGNGSGNGFPDIENQQSKRAAVLQSKTLPSLQPIETFDDSISTEMAPLISMVEELVAYEPELERQQGMLDKLDKLKAAFGQPRLLAPASTLYGGSGL